MAIVLPLAEETLGGRKSFSTDPGSAAGRGGSGEGSAAAGSVGNGSGSRGSGKRGWKPSRTLSDRQTGKITGTKMTGKRDNASIFKQNPADRQTGKTAETKQSPADWQTGKIAETRADRQTGYSEETKQSPADRQTGKRSGNQTKPTLAGMRDRADPQ